MKIQIDDTVRDASNEEVAIIEEQQERAAALIVALDKQAAARASAFIKLAALGLSDSEIVALVG
jgi:hypothetical protein